MKNRLLATAIALLAASAAVPAAAQSDIRVNGSRVHPESITSDAAGNLYTGSVPGTIYRVTAGSTTAEPWIAPSAENGLRSVFGVLAHEGLLWVCDNPPFGGSPQPGARPAVRLFDLDTGRFRAAFTFPGESPAICNDIAISPDNGIYATDTSGGRILVVVPSLPQALVFASSPDLVGIDGIAFAQDGTMYINNVRANTMQRVNQRDSRYGPEYVGLTTLTLSEPVSGPDGLRHVSGNRFLQAEGTGGRVTYVDIDGDTAKITPVKTGLESSPAVTRVGNVGYATEGKINYLFDPALRGQDPGVFMIRAFPLP